MSDELKEGKVEGSEGKIEGADGKVEGVVEEPKEVVPGFESVGKEVSDLRTKLTVTETKLADAAKKLEQFGPTAEVVSRLREVLGATGAAPGTKEDDEKFYQLLVKDPRAAIKMVVDAVREEDRKERFQDEVTKQWEFFNKAYPEYKEFEEDMKKALLEDPSLFAKKGFLEKVFFDIVIEKKPDMLPDLIERRKRLKTMNEIPPFIFEGASQTDHGSDLSGKKIMESLKSASPSSKSYFE